MEKKTRIRNRLGAQYADIIEITAPGEAQAGSPVDITSRSRTPIRRIGVMAGGALEYVFLPGGPYLSGTQSNVNAGATYSFTATSPRQR